MSFFKRIFNKKPERIYLDFASSTPVDTQMIDSFPKISESVLGANPSALHKEGVEAKNILNKSRALVAKVLEVQDSEIIFTSGATESDSLAILGTIRSVIEKGISPERILFYQSMFEHSAVLESAKQIEKLGVKINSLKMENGIVSVKDIVVPENIDFIFISVIYVHNEIGTVQPIQEISKRVRFLRKHNPDIKIIFHIDATQAPLHFSLRVPSLGVDMMTLGATKLYCPKGVGVLYYRNDLEIQPILFGGGQEKGIRPGTQALELIYNFSNALYFAHKNREEYTKKIQELQSFFEDNLLKQNPNVFITGKNTQRTPHITHIAIPKMDSELMVLELDARGIAVSAKSACKNEEDLESQIVLDMYGKDFGAVRFSFGRSTTKKDVLKAVQAFTSVIDKYMN